METLGWFYKTRGATTGIESQDQPVQANLQPLNRKSPWISQLGQINTACFPLHKSIQLTFSIWPAVDDKYELSGKNPAAKAFRDCHASSCCTFKANRWIQSLPVQINSIYIHTGTMNFHLDVLHQSKMTNNQLWNGSCQFCLNHVFSFSVTAVAVFVPFP